MVATAHKMRFAFLTVASVLALAYVRNLSGQTITIGTWIAATGAFFAYLSPLLRWIGTAVTGSDTSANALFLRKVLPWSIGLIVAMCLLVGLQSSVLAWMLP